MDGENTEIEWYQLARESVKIVPIETRNETTAHIGAENHDSALPTTATVSSQHNMLQLSSRRLSELSDTQVAELLTDDSNIDFSVHNKDGTGDMMINRKNDTRLTLQERIDGQISEGNPNVYLDGKLSPLSLGDDSHIVADMNDTTILLQRAHEANRFFASNEDSRVVKDPEWHSLQSSIMQVISRPEPLGYARCDSGNDSANFTGNLSNVNGYNDNIESFIPLRNQSCELPDDVNVLNYEKKHTLTDVLNQTPFYTKGTNEKLMNVHLEDKIVNFATKYDDMESHIDEANDVFTTENTATNTHKEADVDSPQIRSVGGDNLSIHSSIKDDEDQGAAQPDLSLAPVKDTDDRNSVPTKDKYNTVAASDSQCSDVLFVPSTTTLDNQSAHGSLLLQTLSDTSNSLKSDIQRLFNKGGSSHAIDPNVTNHLDMKDYMDSYTISSDLGMGDSINADDLIRKKLSYSTRKNSDIQKDFRSAKPNLTSSVKGANVPSYSFSSSVQSTLGSTNFCIRKIVDEKIEISRGLGGEYKGVISTDSTLTNSISETGVGIMPQFNLTSLSSVESKTSNLNSEEGTIPETIPSLPSSFSEPSYQNVPTKSDTSVSRLLGSTFKKTEDFLKKLEKLELPYLTHDLAKVSENDTSSSLTTNNDNLYYNTNINSGDETNKLLQKKYDESDGEVLQLSDDEILVEQDINTASIMEPVTDATLGGFDGSHLLRADTKMSDNGSLKASDLHITSDDDLGITDVDIGKVSNSKVDAVAKESKIVGYSDDAKRGNKKIDQRSSDGNDRRHFNQKKTETKSKYNYNIDSTTSPESDYSTEKVPNTSGIEHPFAKSEAMKNAELLYNRKSYPLPDNRRKKNYSTVKPGKSHPNVNPGKTSSVPRDTTILKMLMKNTSMNSSSDEYMNLKGGSVRRSELHGENKENNSDSYEATPSSVRSYNGEGSRNVRLETSLNKLLYEYEKPVTGKFSESPLIKKLELLSQILKEAKLKRSSSYASSDASSINVGENSKSLLDTKISEKKSTTSKVDECGTFKLVPTTSKSSCKVITPSKLPKSCPNCCKRDASTNCPTPCISSDESSERSKPLTLQTWTQTKELPGSTSDDLPSRAAVVPRKRWSREENSTEILSQDDAEKEDNQSENGRKRERKNTFVLEEPPPSSTFDSSIMEDKGKGCPAWYFSFASDDTQPINDVPDLNRAYLENRGEGRDALQQCHYAKSHMNLQEAFQLHKKDFIKDSKERVLGIKDECLKKKHTRRPVKKSEATKPVYFAVTKEVQDKPKKIVKVRKPVTMVKKARVPKKFDYSEMNERKLQEKRSNRLKMKNYDLKLREGFLKRRAPNSRKNFYFIERH